MARRHRSGAGAATALAAEVAKRAGIGDRTLILSPADAPWKRDDAAWFKARPDRSHRLRPMVPGEEPTLVSGSIALPPRHEVQVIVRQVAPGRRVRVGFGRDLDYPIPDAEPVIHAMFDLVARGEPGAVVPFAKVAELALRHATAASHGAH